jgi:hypothetical protein
MRSKDTAVNSAGREFWDGQLLSPAVFGANACLVKYDSRARG